jgi:uncharacterized metal-binding protein YceD (DUF177 family)
LKNLSEFKIAYIGLKIGRHSFVYRIDESFFALFEKSPISSGNLTIDLTLDKRETLFVLDFKLDGFVEVPCDRCTELFQLPLNTTYSMFVKFDNDKDEVEEETEVMYISRSDTHIDVSQLIYEFIVVSLPIRMVHPDNEDGSPACSKEVMDFLENKKKNTEEMDQRWSALLKLKQK